MAGRELLGHLIGQLWSGVLEEHDIVAPLPEELGLVEGEAARSEDAERLVAYLPAVAVGAVQDALAPLLGDAGHRRELVDDAGREEDPAGADLPVRERDEEGAIVLPGHRVHGSGGDLHPVLLDLLTADGEQFGGRCALTSEVVVHVSGGGVARMAVIDHQDRAARPAEGQGSAQAGCAATDDHHVVSLAHSRTVPSSWRI